VEYLQKHFTACINQLCGYFLITSESPENFLIGTPSFPVTPYFVDEVLIPAAIMEDIKPAERSVFAVLVEHHESLQKFLIDNAFVGGVLIDDHNPSST
jgi:hypothetical protein